MTIDIDSSGRPSPAEPAVALTPPADDPLGDEIAELCAHINAATYRLLSLLRRYDEQGLWEGCRSCAHWLSWRTGISLGPAREKMRVARCLPSLPLISAALSKGEISYSKVRALTRVATAGNEAELLTFARHGTTAHVERLVRGWRRLEMADACQEARAARRGLSLYLTDDGDYQIRGRLTCSRRCSSWCTPSRDRPLEHCPPRCRPLRHRPWRQNSPWSPRRARAFQLKRLRGSAATRRWSRSRGERTVRCSMSGAASAPSVGGCARRWMRATAGAGSPDANRACAHRPTTSGTGPRAARRRWREGGEGGGDRAGPAEAG